MRWSIAAEGASRNPLRRLPVLELDDGTVLCESVAICRYFEELQPEPALFGRGALGKAQVEMWQRRMEFNLFQPVSHAFRHIHPAMKEWEVPQVPEWGEANKPKALDFLVLMDAELALREFAAGDDFSIADITGLVAIDFMKPARITVPAGTHQRHPLASRASAPAERLRLTVPERPRWRAWKS